MREFSVLKTTSGRGSNSIACKMDIIGYILIGFVVLNCVFRGLTIYYWLFPPDLLTEYSPVIYKGVEYPLVSFLTLIVTLPCVVVLAVPKLRTLPRVLFVCGVLFSFGMASIIGAWFLSFNVTGSGLPYFLSAIYIYRMATNRFKTAG